MKKFVGIAGFEPTTSCSQSKHSSRTELYPEIPQGVDITLQRADRLPDFEDWWRPPDSNRHAAFTRLLVVFKTTALPIRLRPPVYIRFTAPDDQRRSFLMCKHKTLVGICHQFFIYRKNWKTSVEYRVDPVGLEPTISGLQSRCSSQLN